MSRLLAKANWITLMLCVSVIQLSVYYFLSVSCRGDGLFSVVQPDSSLYLQAARRIVEGAPFTFCLGGEVNTGTTSVLYPFLLAVPCALGFSGGSLLAAGFLLNAVFYLVFMFCWAQVIDLKIREPAAKAFAALMMALFGQFAVVSLAQSDIGFWMAVSSLFAFGLARNRVWLWGAVLVLSPWVRPEGMVCVIAALLVAFAVRRHRGVALLGLVSVFGVLVLNRGLSGAWQFTSVQGKGHFVTEPFFTAVMQTFTDALTMFRQLFLGLSSGSFREMFFFPLLGGVCLWYHVFHRDYKDFDSREAIFLLAGAGGFATVAASGWQGTNLDRYLAWLLPVAVIWTACGAVALGLRLKGVARFLPAAFLALFAVAGSVAETCWFRRACERTEISRAFYTTCGQALPKESSYGAFGNAASVYWLSPRRFEHLYGIYSPLFKTKTLVSAFEILKHTPTRRFDYWLYDDSIEGDLVSKESVDAFGTTVLPGPVGLSLRRADWTPFDAALVVPEPPVKGVRLRAAVDVGYEADERESDYDVFGAYAQRAPEPFFRMDSLKGRRIAEVGRVVTGSDEMSVSGLETAKDLHVVMRTALRQRAELVGPAGRKTEDYAFAVSQQLQVVVDGESVGPVTYTVDEKGFTDVTFTVPGAAVRSDSIRIAFAGEHITCGYWFYQ